MRPDEKIAARLAALAGWISDSECTLLYDLASQIGGCCIVEIGSYRGKSTMALATGSAIGHGVAIYAIDPQVPFTSAAGTKFGPPDKAIFFKNIVDFNVAELVYVINLSSEVAVRAWHDDIGMLIVDGDHAKASDDVLLWGPFIVAGGLLLLHDYNTWEGPRNAYQNALAAAYEEMENEDGFIVLRKPGKCRSGLFLPEWEQMVYKGSEKISFSVRGGGSGQRYDLTGTGGSVWVRREDIKSLEWQNFVVS